MNKIDMQSLHQSIINPKNDRDQKIIEKFEKEKKQQKRAFTSFELNVPNASLNFLKQHHMGDVSSLDILYIFCVHKRTQVENIYQKLLENYEREFGDLTDKTDGKENTVYLIASPLFKKGFEPTNNYKYIGFVLTESDTILVAYLHPFFRNRGIMTQFLMLYLVDHPLLLSPPLSKNMCGCLSKLEQMTKENPDLRTYQFNNLKKHFQKKNSKARINALDDNQFFKLKSMYENLQFVVEDIDKHLDKLVEMVLAYDENPDFKEYFERLSSNLDKETIKNFQQHVSDKMNRIL